MSRNIDQIKQAIGYLEEKISSIVKEEVSIRIIKGYKEVPFRTSWSL